MTVLRLASELALPLEAITETIAVIGIRGSGKTNTAVVLAEEFLEHGQQVLIVDPTDVWWGLKSSADGQAPGYPVVVLGGRRQDLPLAAGDGAAIADFVAEQPVSVVCSLRHFESRADQRRFVTELARRLYFRKGQEEQPRPLMVMFDEASLFVPQRVMGDEAKMVGAIQQLVRQGRSSGFGVTLIDQRPASVNKDVLTQLELLVAHRTTSPQDRKALDAWVEQHDVEGVRDAFMGQLASLPRGTAWVWSPGWLNLFQRAAIRARRTFDSSRTPKPGERVIAPREMAAVDLNALRASLGASIERARAEDPKTLQARIRELEARLRRAGAAAAPDAAAIERAVKDATATLAQECRDRLVRQAANMRARLDRAFAELERELDAPLPPAPAVAQAAAPAHPAAIATAPRAIATRPEPSARSTSAGIQPSEQRILDALALMERLGSPGKKVNVGFFAGYADGGRFNNLLSALRTRGLIEYPQPGIVALTAAGLRLADSARVPVQSLADLHALWLGKLPPSEARVLEAVLAVYPRAIAVETLGARTGYAPGGRFNNILSRLRSLGAIDRPRPGEVQATDALFPEGLS